MPIVAVAIPTQAFLNDGTPAVVVEPFGSREVGVCKGTISSVATFYAAVAPFCCRRYPDSGVCECRGTCCFC